MPLLADAPPTTGSPSPPGADAPDSPGPACPPAAPPRFAPPGGRFVLADVDWDTYEKLADGAGNESLGFTYDAATRELEVEMPQGLLHETVSGAIAVLILAFARERAIRTKTVRTVSLRRRRRGGADGDESFYVTNVDRRPAPGTNLLNLAAGDLPPDLVVEVDVTSPGVSKLPIYARLGVPEVWVWTDDAIVCRRLSDAGEYEVVGDSVELPGFPFAFAADLIRDRPDAADGELQDALVERLRAAP